MAKSIQNATEFVLQRVEVEEQKGEDRTVRKSFNEYFYEVD